MASYEELMRDFKKGSYQPVYLLYGTEPFFVDQLSKIAIAHCIAEEEKSFCQKVVYGSDVTCEEVIIFCISQPMSFSTNPRQLVLVKDAQKLKGDTKVLHQYAEKPSPFTVLILCYKFDDKKKATVIDKFPKSAVYFQSNSLYEKDIAKWVKKEVETNGYKISQPAIELILDYLGTDLETIFNEIQKLLLRISDPSIEINVNHINDNFGMIKGFSYYDFAEFVTNRNYAAVDRCIKFYAKNEKEHNLTSIVNVLLRQAINLYLIKLTHHSKMNESSVYSKTGLTDWSFKKLIGQSKNISLYQAEENVMIVNEYHKKSIGIINAGEKRINYHDFLSEMTKKMMMH